MRQHYGDVSAGVTGRSEVESGWWSGSLASSVGGRHQLQGLPAELVTSTVRPLYYAARTNPERKVRQHVRELQALGYTVTLNPAA